MILPKPTAKLLSCTGNSEIALVHGIGHFAATASKCSSCSAVFVLDDKRNAKFFLNGTMMIEISFACLMVLLNL